MENEKKRGVKIESISIFPLDIELETPFKIATMSLDLAKNILIGITASNGLTGWGEGSPFRSIVGETQETCLAAAIEIRPLWLGKDPLAYQQRIAELDAHLPYNPTIRSAFDMALFDLCAQTAGLPLYAFLGGEKRVLDTDLTIGIGSLDEIAAKAQKIVSRGFNKIKTKVGLNKEEDLKRVQIIREATSPDVKIRIDANQGWDRVTAVAVLKAMEPVGIEFCEQPVRRYDLEGMRYICERTSIPIMADETVFSPVDTMRVVETKAAPLINIKLSKSGGILNGMRIAHIAQANYLTCMVGCMSESVLGNTAFAHFAMAMPVVKYFDLDANEGHINEPFIGGAKLENGEVRFPENELPGIGVVPDPDFLKSIKTL
jgi:L-Ala-D/L-Glu epimerase